MACRLWPTGCSKKALYDQLGPVGKAVLEFDLMALPKVFVFTGPRIDRSVLFELAFALLDVRLTDIELRGRSGRHQQRDASKDHG